MKRDQAEEIATELAMMGFKPASDIVMEIAKSLPEPVPAIMKDLLRIFTPIPADPAKGIRGYIPSRADHRGGCASLFRNAALSDRRLILKFMAEEECHPDDLHFVAKSCRVRRVKTKLEDGSYSDWIELSEQETDNRIKDLVGRALEEAGRDIEP
jgi:hypothetical protein